MMFSFTSSFEIDAHWACDVALDVSAGRPDCNIRPVVVEVLGDEHKESGTQFILVDVRYNSRGYCALYEYNRRTGQFLLDQD